MKKNAAVRSLKAADYNPRSITDEQLRILGESLKTFGDLGGIVFNVATGNLVGGHQRVKHLDPAWRVTKQAVSDATGTVARGHIQTPWGMQDYREVNWPIAKEKAANLAANKHGGEFDLSKVAPMIEEIKAAGLKLDLTGFDARELANIDLNAKQPKAGADDVPAAPAKPTAKAGEMWILGRHRLLCGDATDRAAWQRLMGPDKAAMVHTDPPYGVSYEAKSGKFGVIMGDDKRGDDLLKMLTAALTCMKMGAAREAAFYIWHASSTREDFAAAIKRVGLVERQYIIWAKTGIVLGHSDYRWAHEPCFYASRQDAKPAFYGDRAQPTVWRAALARRQTTGTVVGLGLLLRDGEGGELYLLPRAPKGKKIRALRIEGGQQAYVTGADDGQGTVWEVSREQNYAHPTQKPVELATRAIGNSSRPGEIVLDPFLGSGTTLMAAEITGRTCYGMELDPKYADVIVQRWEKMTGQKAERTGRK